MLASLIWYSYVYEPWSDPYSHCTSSFAEQRCSDSFESTDACTPATVDSMPRQRPEFLSRMCPERVVQEDGFGSP
jgi:hypothetical protein